MNFINYQPFKPNKFTLIKVTDNPIGFFDDYMYRSGKGTIGIVIEYRIYSTKINVVFKPIVMYENKLKEPNALRYIYNSPDNLEIDVKYTEKYLG